MKITDLIFKKLARKPKLEYSKTLNEWQVYWESNLVYVGTKDMCLKYISNNEPGLH